jgi:hypothetical protein
MWIGNMVSSMIAERMINKKIVTISASRKIFNSIGRYSQQHVRLYMTVKLLQSIFKLTNFTIKHRFDWEYLTVSTNLILFSVLSRAVSGAE